MTETAEPATNTALGASGPTIHYPFAASGNDDLALVVSLKGACLIRRPGGDVLLGEGDASVVAWGEVGADDQGARLCLRLERRLLGLSARGADEVLGRLIPARTEALGLLVGYARTLASGPLELSPAATRAVAGHMGDLVALIVGAAGAMAPGCGGAAARLGAVKAHIRARIGAEDLSAESVAAEQGISERHLRRLFEAEDQNFSGYVLGQRLANAHAMLCSRSFASRSISQIAYDVGFGDLSYFNRNFRHRYQATPSDVRAEASGARRQRWPLHGADRC